MLVDEDGSKENTEGEHQAAKPHHHPGDHAHVHHGEVGVLLQHNQGCRSGGGVVSNNRSDHQVILHEKEQTWNACCWVAETSLTCLERGAHWLPRLYLGVPLVPPFSATRAPGHRGTGQTLVRTQDHKPAQTIEGS